MENKIFQEIAESYLSNQITILRNLGAKISFPFISKFASETEKLLNEKFYNINTKKDLIAFQNFIDTLDEINGIFLRTTDESTYWVMPLIKQFYSLLGIELEDREILIINDHRVNYYDGGYGVIVDLFNNNNNLSSLKFGIDKKIDVYFLPYQSNFSISSIAILAHEVGHVYFNTRKGIKNQIVTEIVKQLANDGKSTDLYNNPAERFLRTNISSHVEEFICDSIGNYLLGPIFNFASIKILGLVDDDDLVFSSGKHPPIFRRLDNEKKRFEDFFSQLTPGTPIHIAIEKIKDRFFDNPFLIPPISDSFSQEDNYYIKLANSISEQIFSIYFNKEQRYKFEDYEKSLQKSLRNLNKLIPLVETIDKYNEEIVTPWELIVATILYFSGNLYETENEFYIGSPEKTEEKRSQLKKILISFIKYSINIYSFYEKVKVKGPPLSESNLSIWDLRERKDAANEPFVVVPTIDRERQYSSNAVDLRLGNSFITSKLTEFTHIPTKPENKNLLSDKKIEYFFEKHFIPFNKNFTLHPHNFVLAVTLEYISIPSDYYALVLGRSTWGRLGLNIATATAVGPGFKGCITLELRNLSEVPITLNVGTRICQICLIKNPIEGSTQYYLSKNKYICPVEVEYPKINLDPDWELLEKFDKPTSKD